jgi:hypothetical protein
MSTFTSCTSTIGISLFDVGAPKVISVLLTMLPLASVVQEVKVDMPTLSVAHTGGFTTVTTDLLTVEISHKGGTIQNAYLDGFPVEKRVICHLSHKMKTVKKIAMPRNNF